MVIYTSKNREGVTNGITRSEEIRLISIIETIDPLGFMFSAYSEGQRSRGIRSEALKTKETK
jgi:hypothetical protein